MTLDIRKPADKRFAKGLIFSPAGHGKTHLLGTAQEDERTSPMLLMDFEGGDETLAGLDIDVVEIRSWDDYNEVYELLTSDSKEQRYRSIGLDSASETHIWALLTRLEEQAPRRKEPDLIELGDYGVGATQMRRLLREFRDLPYHVFFTAGSREIDERGVGKVKIPNLAGQMGEEIVHIMSIVGYLATSINDDGEFERILILQNYPGFRTKVRAPWKTVAPDDLVNPTITTLLDALEFKAVAQTNGQRTTTRRQSRRPTAQQQSEAEPSEAEPEKEK